MKFTIVVDTIGTVFETTHYGEAGQKMDDYVQMSLFGPNKEADKNVTMYADGKVALEYVAGRDTDWFVEE
jgi:hypothetical protein